MVIFPSSFLLMWNPQSTLEKNRALVTTNCHWSIRFITKNTVAKIFFKIFLLIAWFIAESWFIYLIFEDIILPSSRPEIFLSFLPIKFLWWSKKKIMSFELRLGCSFQLKRGIHRSWDLRWRGWSGSWNLKLSIRYSASRLLSRCWELLQPPSVWTWALFWRCLRHNRGSLMIGRVVLWWGRAATRVPR